MFLKTRLLQAGFKPCGKIGADKATWKHRSRQFVSFVTVVPDSDDVIHVFYLGHPVVKSHNGQGVTQSIINVLKEYNIDNEQYLGGSFDGAYFSLNVPELLDEYFGFIENSKHHDLDPSHKAGLQDVHLRKEKKFSWLVLHKATISSVFTLVNYGKEFEHLWDIAKDMNESQNLEIEFKLPAFFSETRFANSVKNV